MTAGQRQADRPPSKDLRKALAIHGFTVGVFLVWVVGAGRLPAYELPGPLKVGTSLVWLMSTPAGLWHIAASLLHVAASMFLAFVIGTAIALLPYYLPVFRLTVDGRLTPFINAFPGIGWTMLAIVWLGVGFETILFSVSIILLPFMIINLREGVTTLDGDLIEMARSFERSRWRQFRLIVLPQLSPFIFVAIRVSFGVSWKVTLTAELLGGTDGLGYLMNVARQELNTAQVFAIIVLVILLVFAINRLVFDLLFRRGRPGRAATF